MLKKLLRLSKLKLDPNSPNFQIVATIIIVILYFGSISQM